MGRHGAAGTKIHVRKGMPDRELMRAEFDGVYMRAFVDPAFSSLRLELERIADAAWDAYAKSRKAPYTRRAGPGFADPSYKLSCDWSHSDQCCAGAIRER
jgi:hypothetical protein